MKKLLISTLIALSFSTAASAVDQNKNINAHKDFRGEALVVEGQESWYRELRLDDWVSLGLPQADIDGVLENVKGSGKLRDEANLDAPGFWTYEFSKQAEIVFDRALKHSFLVSSTKEAEKVANEFQKASVLWMIASYPNLHQANELAALDKSVTAYIKAAMMRGENVERVHMPLSDSVVYPTTITGLLHLPKAVEKAPVILWTGGVDKTLVEHRSQFMEALNKGFAVLTFDIPGAGLNTNIVMELGKEDQAHQAALAYAKSDGRLDKKRIGALSSSGGGIPLMEFAFKQKELKAVVARCAVVDGVLTKPFLFPKLPLMTAQSFGQRVGADIHDLSSYGDITIPLSLKTKGYFDGKPRMETPLLVINTSGDMVASPEDMKKTAALSSSSEIKFFGDDGHCPDGKAAEQAIVSFLTRNI